MNAQRRRARRQRRRENNNFVRTIYDEKTRDIKNLKKSAHIKILYQPIEKRREEKEKRRELEEKKILFRV
jgi:hypothetical protein|tara:strand:- start:817 stop:1026 length:210 start_codon:yes stop_codon:yes gene_type:complete